MDDCKPVTLVLFLRIIDRYRYIGRWIDAYIYVNMMDARLNLGEYGMVGNSMGCGIALSEFGSVISNELCAEFPHLSVPGPFL